MTKSFNKIAILLVVLLMCLTVVFAACSKANFKPVAMPEKGEVSSNGGIAVVYGDWLYYVNGYTANVSADNTYSSDVVDAPRIGSVVRIKLAEIEKIFAINDDDDLSSSEKTTKIASAVRGDVEGITGAETVIPKIYYSGNTSTTQFTGIFIFGDRIYVTTPNDQLTANGDPLTDQLVLMSFKLNGDDAKSHFTFTKSDAQIWLTEKNGKVVATYLMDNKLYALDVASGKETIVSMNNDPASEVENTVSNVNWDETDGSVFFLDKFGSVCKVAVGEDKYEVIVENKDYELHEHDGTKHIEAGATTYAIKFVNGGIVYYTVSNSEKDTVTGGVVMYWAKSATESDKTALPSSSVSVHAWKANKFITTDSYKTKDKTYYSICIVTVDDSEEEIKYSKKKILDYGENDSSITITKLEGNLLYYTADSISYVIDLEEVEDELLNNGTPYAKSLAATTGWAAPDFVDVKTADGTLHYIISAGTDSVTLAKFNPDDTKSATVSIALTLTAKPVEE